MHTPVCNQTNCLRCASRSLFIHTMSFVYNYSTILTQLFSFTAQCPELPSFPNGAITYFPDFIPDFNDGTVATYRCNPGFFLVEIATRTCLISSTWAGQPPVCQRKIRLDIIGSGETKLRIFKLTCSFVSACACFAFYASVNMHTQVVCNQTNCLGCASRSTRCSCSYILDTEQCVCVLSSCESLLCILPLQRWNVQHCNPFQTELLHMVPIRLLLLMWIQWLLIAVMMASFWWSDLRFERV